MLINILCAISLLLVISCSKQNILEANKTTYTYLALGDSYTIGTGISTSNNFPNQLIDSLINYNYKNIDFEISAKNGWTTTNLEASFSESFSTKTYDFVTLLIGVNNQYQGKSIDVYEYEYNIILDRAIAFANGSSKNVIVLSIPDYSVTPFVNENRKAIVANEIELYNNKKRSITEAKNIKFIDITSLTQKAAFEKSLLANDNLHPSAKQYSLWVHKMLPDVISRLK